MPANKVGKVSWWAKIYDCQGVHLWIPAWQASKKNQSIEEVFVRRVDRIHLCRGLIHTDARINTGPHSVWPRQRDWDRKLGTMSDGFYLLWGSHYCWDLRQVASDRYTSFHLENGNTWQKMLNIKKYIYKKWLNVPSSWDVIIHAAVTVGTSLQLHAGTVIWFLNNHIKGQTKWMWKFVTTEH